MVGAPSKNATKSKEAFHPYDTRSRRSKNHPLSQLKDNIRSRNNHDKNHHPSKDSVSGSSNTIVKGKPAAGGRPAKKVPLSFYNCVQAAPVARKVWEAKRDKDSELELELAEDLVNASAYYYKYIDRILPRNWKYNPATASTLVPKDNIPLLRLVTESEMKMKTKRREDDPHSDSYNLCNRSTELRKVNNVPLKEDETESWLQFKKLDEGNPTPVPCQRLYDLKFPVSTEHPFVSVIGYFAVNGFNEAYEMFVERSNHNRLHDLAFSKCRYFRMGGSYWFYTTIVADEDGFRGIYKARVKCTGDHGKRTLKEFTFTDIKQGDVRMFAIHPRNSLKSTVFP